MFEISLVAVALTVFGVTTGTLGAPANAQGNLADSVSGAGNQLKLSGASEPIFAAISEAAYKDCSNLKVVFQRIDARFDVGTHRHLA